MLVSENREYIQSVAEPLGWQSAEPQGWLAVKDSLMNQLADEIVTVEQALHRIYCVADYVGELDLRESAFIGIVNANQIERVLADLGIVELTR